jgi:4-hydroxybenzoate polyprenyltransferase
MNYLQTYISTLRPRQWIKNGLIFIPFLFTISEMWSPNDLPVMIELLARLGLLFGAFCLVVSSVYIFNDLMDRSRDAQHPKKRERPLASGKISIIVAVVSIAIFALLGMGFLYLLDIKLLGIGIIYVLVNLTYSLGAKDIVLIDVMLVASGYVIRTGAGAVSIGVTPSPWLYTVTASAAVFIVLGRRYAELRLLGPDHVPHRIVLERYSGPFISQLLTISATASLLSYTLYTVEAVNLPDNGAMLLTVPMVTFGLFRYLYLLNSSDDAESPERLIFEDIPLLLTCATWLITSILVLWISSI